MSRKHKYLDELLKLLKPFHIGKIYADGNFAYSDKIPEKKLITGNRNRPGFQRMLSEIEREKFDVVLTKDLSRLGRDYADTGKLTGETFPKKRIRYIAVNDSVNTSHVIPD